MDPSSFEDRSVGWRIVMAGTGGQGVLTAARLLCDGLVRHGHDVVSGRLHGMAQRGGSVQSCVLIDCGISPVVARGGADFVLGFELVETVRALPFMSKRTVVYMNSDPVIPYVLAQRSISQHSNGKYPKIAELINAVQDVTTYLSSFDATRRAVEAGSAKALNMVMLGCLIGSSSLPCTVDEFWRVVADRMPQGLTDANSRAFFSGAALAKEFGVSEAKP